METEFSTGRHFSLGRHQRPLNVDAIIIEIGNVFYCAIIYRRERYYEFYGQRQYWRMEISTDKYSDLGAYVTKKSKKTGNKQELNL